MQVEGTACAVCPVILFHRPRSSGTGLGVNEGEEKRWQFQKQERRARRVAGGTVSSPNKHCLVVVGGGLQAGSFAFEN